MRMVDIQNTYIEEYFKDHELYSAYGKVNEVNEEFCAVSLEDKAPVDEVRVYFPNSGIKIIPKQGSRCIITFTSPTDAFISLFEEIERIEIVSDKIEGRSEIVLNDGKNGGLVKVEPLVNALNSIIKDLNALRKAISEAPVSPGDGGTSFKAYLMTKWASQVKTEITKSQIENTKIKH